MKERFFFWLHLIEVSKEQLTNLSTYVLSASKSKEFTLSKKKKVGWGKIKRNKEREDGLTNPYDR